MAGGIYILRDDGQLVRMEQQPYDSEALLQRLLADYPDLLAGDQIDSDEPRRWLLIQREAPIQIMEAGPAWLSVDGLFVDQDGVPTLVEVKRGDDTRIRREVVGQMLDYAANLAAYWSADRFRTEFESRCQALKMEPLGIFAEAFGDETDYGEFWQRVKTNLLAKRLRLLFVADDIPQELRRVVEFLNEVMDPVEVLAVQIQQYVGEQHKALVPRVIGQTAQAQSQKGMPSNVKANQDRFLASWDRDPHSKSVYARILALADQHQLAINWGTKGFSLNIPIGNQKIEILEGYPPGVSRGAAYLIFAAVRRRVRDPEPIIEWYRSELSQVTAISDAGTLMRCVVEQLNQLEEDRLCEIIVDVVRQVREHGLATV